MGPGDQLFYKKNPLFYKKNPCGFMPLPKGLHENAIAVFPSSIADFIRMYGADDWEAPVQQRKLR
jgi:hypothetical protein